MAFLVIAAVAYLVGAASAFFLLTAIGIRENDRPERILNDGSNWSKACSRRVLDSGTWPDIPVYRSGPGGEDRDGRPG